MKRITLLGAVLAILVVMAMPVAAATTLGVAGELTYGMTSNGTVTADAFSNAYINFALTVDPNNMVVLELFTNKLLAWEPGAINQNQLIAVPLFYLKSDLASAIMMDPKTVDPVLYAGWGNATLPGYGASGYGNEDIAALGIGGEASGMNAAEGAPAPYVALNTSIMGSVNVLLGVSSTAFAATNNMAIIGAYTTIGPVSIEAGYSMDPNNAGLSNGVVSGGALLNLKMGDLAINATGQAVYKLATAVTNNLFWGVGAGVVFQGNYDVGVGVSNYYPADQTAAAMKVSANVDATFAKNLGVNVGLLLNTATSNPSVFDTLDLSAWTTFGPTKVRVGYLYFANPKAVDAFNGAYEAATGNGTNGGVYFTVDLPF